MDQFINENVEKETFTFDNIYSSEQLSSYNYTNGISASDDNDHHAPNATTPMTSFAIYGHVGYPSNNNAINEQVSIQNPSNLSINSSNTAFNSPQIQTN